MYIGKLIPSLSKDLSSMVLNSWNLISAKWTNGCVREMLLTVLEAEPGIVGIIASVLCRAGSRSVLIRVP